MSIVSWRFVRERERPGDPAGVRRPEPDPPGDQTAAPAARYDPGRAAAIRLCHHRWGRQEGDERRVGTGERADGWVQDYKSFHILNNSGWLCFYKTDFKSVYWFKDVFGSHQPVPTNTEKDTDFTLQPLLCAPGKVSCLYDRLWKLINHLLWLCQAPTLQCLTFRPLCCISPPAGHCQSTTVGLSCSLPAGGSQKPERSEVSNNSVVVVLVRSVFKK